MFGYVYCNILSGLCLLFGILKQSVLLYSVSGSLVGIGQTIGVIYL